jgi:predicted RNA-binding protein with PIN domain
VVLDGRPPPDLAEGVHGCVAVHYARRRGRDAADDRIVELVAGDDDPGKLRVVTSDRALADRVTALGATTEGAGAFLRRLQRLGA